MKRLFLKLMVPIMIFVTFSVSYAAEYEELPTGFSNDIWKPWTIKFSGSVNPDSIDNNTVKVEDKDGWTQNIVLKIDGDKVELETLEPYQQGRMYYIFIDKEVESECGKKLQTSLRKPFMIVEEGKTMYSMREVTDFTSGYTICANIENANFYVIRDKKSGLDIAEPCKNGHESKVLTLMAENMDGMEVVFYKDENCSELVAKGRFKDGQVIDLIQ